MDSETANKTTTPSRGDGKKVYVKEMWLGRWVYAISDTPRIEGTWSERDAYPSRRRAERSGRKALRKQQLEKRLDKKWHVVAE